MREGGMDVQLRAVYPGKLLERRFVLLFVGETGVKESTVDATHCASHSGIPFTARRVSPWLVRQTSMYLCMIGCGIVMSSEAIARGVLNGWNASGIQATVQCRPKE